MAQVTVNYDKDAEELTVSINGVAIPNVRCVYFEQYPDWDDSTKMQISCCVETYIKGQDGVSVNTRLIAKDSPEGRMAINNNAKLHKEFRDFVVMSGSDKAKNDIINYFS